MKKMRKNVLLTLCAGALSLVCATGVAMVNASADVTEDTDGKVSVSSLTMIQTASAYIGDISTTSVTGGLRFDATLSKADYDELNKNYNAVKFGMLVTPTDFITTDAETDLVVGSTTLPEYVAGVTYTATDKGMVNQEITPVYNTKDYPELYTFRCAMTDIKEYNFSRPFTARAYIATQKEENGTWEYTYAGTAERAIYSLATYAMNDNLTFSEDADKQQAVESYLNSIIDKVQQYYDITVTQTVNDGSTTEAKIGDTITLNGVATKIGDTSKSLDMCPTVTVTENSSLTPVANTQGRKYKVTGLGNVAYSWTSGNKSGESQVNGQTKLDILTSKDQLSNVVMREGAQSTAQVVYVDEQHAGYDKYVIFEQNSYIETVKKHDVFAWSLKDGETATTKQTFLQNGFTFTNEIKQYIKAGTYLYFDIVVPNSITAGGASSGAPDGNLVLAYLNDAQDKCYYFTSTCTTTVSQAYTKAGVKATGDWNWGNTYTNTWMRVKFEVPYDWANYVNAMFTVNTNTSGQEFDGTVYISNIFVSSENLENSSGNMSAIEKIKNTTADVQNFTTPATVFKKATSNVTFEKLVVEDGDTTTASIVGDRTDVYKYATNANVKDYGAGRIYVQQSFNAVLDVYRYLTFDVYFVSGTCRNGFHVRVGSTDEIKYFFSGQGKQHVGTNYVMSCYNISGTKPTLSTNAVGKWYTIEIWYRGNAVVKDHATNYAQYFAMGTANSVAYISNVRISNYSLMGTTV